MSKPENSVSTRIPPLNTPKGTSYYPKKSKPWCGRLVFNGKNYQKYFYSQEEAHDWYLKKSEELYGFDRFKKELDDATI